MADAIIVGRNDITKSVYIPISYTVTTTRSSSGDGGSGSIPLDLSAVTSNAGSYVARINLHVTAEVTTGSGSYYTTLVYISDGKLGVYFGENADQNSTKTFSIDFVNNRIVEVTGTKRSGTTQVSENMKLDDFSISFNQSYGNWGRSSTVVWTITGGITFVSL